MIFWQPIFCCDFEHEPLVSGFSTKKKHWILFKRDGLKHTQKAEEEEEDKWVEKKAEWVVNRKQY